VTAKRSIGQRIIGLPGAVWHRLLHQWALFRARRLSLARTAIRRPQRLLVMCYGNIYRSPFVAAWLGTRLAGQPGFEIRSAGFHHVPARPSPREYVRLASDYRIDLEPHRSRLVEPADLEWAEAIVIMDRYNWERLRPSGAEVQGKIIWLGAFTAAGPVEIEDPYALPLPRVQAIVEQMRVAADGLVHQLLAKRG
jgi:protein-tyrosine phosphatase